jgi:hypothetical protein
MFADEEKQYSYFQQDNATQQHITTFYWGPSWNFGWKDNWSGTVAASFARFGLHVRKLVAKSVQEQFAYPNGPPELNYEYNTQYYRRWIGVSVPKLLAPESYMFRRGWTPLWAVSLKYR